MNDLYKVQILIAEHLKINPGDLGALITACNSGIQSAIGEANERANNQGAIANCALLLLDSKRMSSQARDSIHENMARAIGKGDGTPIQDLYKAKEAS